MLSLGIDFMARRIVIPSRGIDVGLQILWMRERFPSFCYSREPGWIGWIGSLQPTELSPNYKLRIEYRGAQSPKVHVIDPPIHAGAPHMYADGSLCLFYPRDRSWGKQTIIAQAIVPWAAEWLFFYECWLETDTWWADQVSHTGRKMENDKRRAL